MKLLHRIFTSMVGVSFLVTLAFVILYAFIGYDWILLFPVMFLSYIIIRSVVELFKDHIFKITKIIKIKHGKHRAEWGLKPVISFGKLRLDYKFQFFNSCIYAFPYNGGEKHQDMNHNLDVNKLFGVSHLGVHSNSARFGWNCDVEKKKINIFAYYYLDGVRKFSQIKSVPTGEYIVFSLVHRENFIHYYIDGEYCFSHKFPKVIIGYQNFVYFGGKMTAPHEMLMFKTKKNNKNE